VCIAYTWDFINFDIIKNIRMISDQLEIVDLYYKLYTVKSYVKYVLLPYKSYKRLQT